MLVDVKMVWLAFVVLFAHCRSVAAMARLDEIARQAHEEIPLLRRQEHDRNLIFERKILEQSISHQRELYQDSQYYTNQYNGYQYDQYQGWNPSMAETEFGFDITRYSFKYTGCHDVGQTINADGSPSRYATFRLCPTESCSAMSTWGCKSDYGEYIVPVDLLVASLIEHNQARVLGYCEYCQNCAAIESYSQFATEVLLHKQYVLSYAQQKFAKWCART